MVSCRFSLKSTHCTVHGPTELLPLTAAASFSAASLRLAQDDGPQRLQRGLRRCQSGEPSFVSRAAKRAARGGRSKETFFLNEGWPSQKFPEGRTWNCWLLKFRGSNMNDMDWYGLYPLLNEEAMSTHDYWPASSWSRGPKRETSPKEQTEVYQSTLTFPSAT